MSPRGAAVVVLALAATGCDGVFGPGERGPAAPITELPRPLTAAESAAIGASNTFGLDLLREVVREDPGRSVFLSPFSASMALGMTLNGAEGETFDAMRTTLRFGALDRDAINGAYRGLLDLLGGLDPDVTLRTGNSVWHSESYRIVDAFESRVRDHFDARVQGLDFAAPGAAGVINEWVRDATAGRIEEIAPSPIPGNIVAYLINAVYFDAGWSVPFDREKTVDAPFHLPDGSTAPIRLMVRDDTIGFAATERYVAADLPYGRQAWAMTVVVPTGEASVEDLVEELDAAAWTALTGSFQAMRTMVALPRFELEWKKSLNDALAAMGMGIAFQPGAADFSAMFEGGGPWIDEVLQKTFVRVDEEGTEAAAVTSVSMTDSAPPMVWADRPFLFAIRERLSGTLLFLGVISEAPTM